MQRYIDSVRANRYSAHQVGAGRARIHRRAVSQRTELRRHRRGRHQRGRHGRHGQRGRHHRRRRRGFYRRGGSLRSHRQFCTSYDRVTSPLNSLVVSGIPTTTSSAIAVFRVLRATVHHRLQLLGFAEHSAPEHHAAELFCTIPTSRSRLSIGFNQPLLAGFGRMPNERFITVARNNVATADRCSSSR